MKFTNLEHEGENQLSPLVETLWPAGESGMVSGPPEVGKTWYAFAEAIGLALGLPVLGAFAVPERRRVLFIEEEASEAANRRRVHDVLRAYGASDRLHELTEWLSVVSFHGVQLCEPASIDELGQAINDSRAHVVYLDSFFRMMPGQDLMGNKAATQALSNLDRLARQYDVVFRVVHHDTKHGDSLYGSQALMAWRRDGLQISEGGQIRYQGNNAGSLPLGRMQLEFDDETGALTAASCTPVDSAEARIAKVLSAGPASAEAIATAAKVSTEYARRVLPRLAERAGQVSGTNGRPGTLWALRAPATS